MKRIGSTVIVAKGVTTLRLAKRELRQVIENDPDPVVQRIAQGMENTIRWVTEKTVGWQKPAVEAKLLAEMLREELKLPPCGDGRGTS